MANRTSRTIRSGVIGFVAGVAALGVVATAQPLHSAVSTAVGAELGTADRHHGDAGRGGDAWLQPQAQGGDQWRIQPDQSQAPVPDVQPAPQQAPQSQAS